MQMKNLFGPQGSRSRKLILAAFAVLVLGAFTTARAFQDRDNGRDNDGRDNDHERFAIGLWGDLPYSDVQAQVGVPNLIADMNKQELAFTVHDGDLKAGNGTPGSVTPTICSDALYVQGLGFFNALRAPAILRRATTIGPTVTGLQRRLQFAGAAGP